MGELEAERSWDKRDFSSVQASTPEKISCPGATNSASAPLGGPGAKEQPGVWSAPQRNLLSLPEAWENATWNLQPTGIFSAGLHSAKQPILRWESELDCPRDWALARGSRSHRAGHGMILWVSHWTATNRPQNPNTD